MVGGMVGRLLVSALVLSAASPLRANSISFATGPQLLSGWAENASAEFEINNTTHSITVCLLNLEFDPANVNQAIGSLRFTLTGAGTPTPDAAPIGISDTRLDISNNGTPSNVSPETTTVWQTAASAQLTGWQVQLCTVCAGGGSDGLIIGGPNALSGGKYASADATLKGGSTAQWIIGSGLVYSGNANANKLGGKDTSPTFTIQFQPTVSLTNVTITNVIFGFGEDPNYGWNFIEAPVETPEPDTIVLYSAGIGFMIVAMVLRRSHRR